MMDERRKQGYGAFNAEDTGNGVGVCLTLINRSGIVGWTEEESMLMA
jgi:hypothetical protein